MLTCTRPLIFWKYVQRQMRGFEALSHLQLFRQFILFIITLVINAHKNTSSQAKIIRSHITLTKFVNSVTQ